jgi:hypothetical protein
MTQLEDTGEQPCSAVLDLVGSIGYNICMAELSIFRKFRSKLVYTIIYRILQQKTKPSPPEQRWFYLQI